MTKYDLCQDAIDAYYARVRKCGLKPKTDTVWQTLDETETYNVPDPRSKDAEEREAHLKNLEIMTCKPDRP